jgi:sporulation protein YlmC with PRC-barrel domain
MPGARIRGGEDNASPGPAIMAVDTLEGDRVVDRDGQSLGAIDDIVVDVERGIIAYAVMSCGGDRAAGEKLCAIPWSALTLDADRHCFVFDGARERLASAPAFGHDMWPAMADAAWAIGLHAWYGVPPYWAPERP